MKRKEQQKIDINEKKTRSQKSRAQDTEGRKRRMGYSGIEPETDTRGERGE